MKALFALVGTAGIVLIAWVYALYRETEWVAVCNSPSWTRHVTVLLMWPASICLVAAYIPGDHQAHAQTSDAGRRVKLWAVGAPHCEWRPRFDHSVRIDPGLGRL